MCFFPLYVIGLHFNKYKNNLIRFDGKIILLLNLLFFLILFKFYNENILIYNSGTDLFSQYSSLSQLKFNLYRIVIGISGSILVIELCRKILKCENGISKKFFELISIFGFENSDKYPGRDLLNTENNYVIYANNSYYDGTNIVDGLTESMNESLKYGEYILSTNYFK